MKKDFKKTKFEIRRKTLHILVGLFFIFVIGLDLINAMQIFLILVFGVFLSLMSRHYDIPFIKEMLLMFDRKEDLEKLPGQGAIFFVFGVLLTYKLFDKDLALASIWVLTFSDSIASILRTYYNERKDLYKKRLFGNVIGAIISWLGASIFIGPVYGLFAAIGGSVAEYLEWEINKNSVNDNFIIPLAAATTVIIVRKIFNI